jgi:TetR/AcrR family transcriptional repressor of nem operon
MTVIRDARDQFWSKGFAATTVEDLTVATGLGKGSLYGAFGGKRELFLRVFDDYCAEVMDQASDELAGSDDQAYQRLRAHLLGKATESAATIRGCLLAKETAELAGEDPAVARRALQAYDRYEELLVTAVHQAQRHGDIDPKADARALGRLLIAVLRGIEALGKAGKDEAFLHSTAEATLAALPVTRLPPNQHDQPATA